MERHSFGDTVHALFLTDIARNIGTIVIPSEQVLKCLVKDSHLHIRELLGFFLCHGYTLNIFAAPEYLSSFVKATT